MNSSKLRSAWATSPALAASIDTLKAIAEEGWPSNTLSRLPLCDIMFWWLTEDRGPG
jgi:hypothetical protein